uniref:Glycosyltransferase n=1 Tax=Candidatus Kentrum sp. LPFa TaxID=2126335 RepID=A0A450W6Q6_9GAMM|nr:MAG: hypothetical protein BECKLPF1236A_GA0070988_100748 [Candidatus Kentron sp. LPFa]VFK28988.1 MAG: hypothetical protein BECKLPF1236C_GA0070990_100789 [Candidatus Kentron sp. LPFa]
MPESPRNARILIFAKAPALGAVKTRLIPLLGAQRAAMLQAALISHTLAITAQSGLDVELWCHPDCRHPWFSVCARTFTISLHDQRGVDLGERMHHAAKSTPATAAVILIGTDCPSLTADELRETSACLGKGDNDAVLGPALDGGYYLLGLNRIHPSLFQGVSWGSDQVLAETRQRLRALGWAWRENPARRDVDRPDDLVFLPSALWDVVEKGGAIDGFQEKSEALSRCVDLCAPLDLSIGKIKIPKKSVPAQGTSRLDSVATR